KRPGREQNMSDSQHIERIIREYFAAMTAGPEQTLQLTDQIEVSGSMLPEPLHGIAAVREHLQQIAPFISRTEVLEIVIDRNSAAVRVLIHSLNGVEVESAFFFRIHHGQISRVRSLFDTRTLMQGSNN
ncbi:MAG TPA: nuclear transport factor 2 family protein, partial [Xanthomonadales bacterium]|nr:nuclear transport factor 2 family protein [Xanthomonadales bacterium]